DRGIKRIVAQVVDLHALDPHTDLPQHVVHQVVRHRPRQPDALELGGDRAGFDEADPDRHRVLAFFVLEHQDGHVGERIDRQPRHLPVAHHGPLPRALGLGAAQSAAASVPSSVCARVSKILTFSSLPTKSAATWPSGKRKLTTWLPEVRPHSCPPPCFDSPSHSTVSVRPKSRARRRAVISRWSACTCASRSLFSSTETSSASANAGVPGRGEYLNE